MAPYYRSITSTSSVLPLDKPLLESLEKANEDELKTLDDRLAEAEKTEGESEISDALKARANYLTRIGDKVCYKLPLILSFLVDNNKKRIEQSKLRNLHWKRHQD